MGRMFGNQVSVDNDYISAKEDDNADYDASVWSLEMEKLWRNV